MGGTKDSSLMVVSPKMAEEFIQDAFTEQLSKCQASNPSGGRYLKE